ncbi:MAG: hypothetical protein ACKO4V_09150 [Planctomycetota bacterium]
MALKTQAERLTTTLTIGDALEAVSRGKDAVRAQSADRVAITARLEERLSKAGKLPAPRGGSALRIDLPVVVAARLVLDQEYAVVEEGLSDAADERLAMLDRLEAVHQARRALKRIQSLNDLFRSAMRFGRMRAKASLRRAKAHLSEVRQRDALGALLEELCALKGQPLTTVADATPTLATLSPSATPLRGARDAAAIARRAMRLPAGATLDWHEITRTFKKSWARGRRFAERSWVGLGERDLHDARKAFQRLSDHLVVLGDAGGERAAITRRRLRDAAQALGRARDLAILVDAIEGTTPEGRAIAARALRLRTAAVREARALSRAALRRSAGSVARRMRARVARV